jgi:hypothetical protein
MSARYTHPAQRRAEQAAEQLKDDLDALFRLAVGRQVGRDWTGDVAPEVCMHFDQGLVGTLRQLIENAEQVEQITADQVRVGDLIELMIDGGDRCYEPREVEAVITGDAAYIEDAVTVAFTDEQPPATFRPAEKLWRVTYGEPVEEPAPVWLSPQGRALIAGMLDPDVMEEERNTGDGQVFAADEVWAEVKAALPPDVYRQSLNEEGQIA